jgi:hypothetical protein
MTNECPDYIMVVPKENDVPEIMGSCDKEDLEEFKSLKREKMFIFKRVGK